MRTMMTWLLAGLLCTACGFAGTVLAFEVAGDRLQGPPGDRGPSGPAGPVGPQQEAVDTAGLAQLLTRYDQRITQVEGDVGDAATDVEELSTAARFPGPCDGTLSQVVTDVTDYDRDGVYNVNRTPLVCLQRP